MSENNSESVQLLSAEPARQSTSANFVLESNTSRQLYNDPNENLIALGDVNGNQTVVSAKTLRWGINTIDPTGTAMAGPGGGRMQLPEKWGSNGKVLGITGGIIDWVDMVTASENYISINNPFGFANYGTFSIKNQNFTVTDLANKYDNFRFTQYQVGSDQNQFERNSFTGLDLSLVRVSSTIGLFCDASGFSATTIGWQNKTERDFSVLIGTNLELSANIPNDGEIVLGIGNLGYDDRVMKTEPRVLTIGNGDISNNDSVNTRSDAMFILKSGDTVFNNNVSISGDVTIDSDLSLNADVYINGGNFTMKNSSLNVDDDVSCSNILINSLLKTTTTEFNSVFSRSAESYGNMPIGSATGKLDFITEKGMRYKHYKTTVAAYEPYGDDVGMRLSFSNLANHKYTYEYTGGIQIFTSRVDNNLRQNSTYHYSTENANRGAYGTIQILHPDAMTVDNSNITGMDGTGLHPPYERIPFRGTNITWYGVSSEEISCNTLNVDGFHFPPKYYDNNGNVINTTGTDGHILISRGDGTSRWGPVEIGTQLDISISQLNDTYIDTTKGRDFLYLGKAARENTNREYSGIMTNELVLDSSANIKGDVDISGYLVVDNSINVTYGGANISGDVSMGHDLIVANNVTIGNDLTINATLDVSNGITTGQCSISGDTVIDGYTVVKNNFDVSDNIMVGGNIDASENIFTDKDFICSGNVYFSNIDVSSENLLYKGNTYRSLIHVIYKQVADALGNQITTPTGSIMWFARLTPPMNYAKCNGRYLSRTAYADLSENLAPYIGNIIDDPSQNLVINIAEDLATSSTKSIECTDLLSKERVDFAGYSLGNYSNTFNLVANQTFRIDISSAATNLNTITVKVKNETTGTEVSDTKQWSNISSSATIVGNTYHVSYTMPSSITGETGTEFLLEVSVTDTVTNNYILYSSTVANKKETYVANSFSDFKVKYLKVPDLMGEFFRGGETNIGHTYSDTIRNHSHQAIPHNHTISLDGTFPHNHVATNAIDISIPGHQHTTPLSYVSVNSSKVFSAENRTAPLDVDVLINPNNTLNIDMDTNINVNNMINAGGTTITNGVDTTIANDNLNVSFNNITGTTESDISGVLDMNKAFITDNHETRPKHMVLLPCISLGKNTEEYSSETSTANLQSRVLWLENRMNALDICMNTHRLGVMNFTENPSGDGRNLG